jgi:LexA-binding, inner membrane-associated putative hydrolase
MILGHFGVALAAKRVSKRTSLGTLIFAAQWADLLWPIMLLTGAAQVRVVPGHMAANPLEFVRFPYSHSLVMLVVWGAVLGAIYYAVRRDARGAWVLGALVVSHWFIDLIVHGPDLPLWPGSPMRLGLGLWNSVPGTLIAEFGLLIAGTWVYLRTTTARDRIGSWGLWTMLVALSAVLLSGFTGPPPVPRVIAYAALMLWLFVPWGYWVDRHRETAEPVVAD